MDWIGGSGKMGKGLDISNRSEKKAALATAAMLTGIGGNGGNGGDGGDGSNKMTATAATQDLIMIRRRQQQDIGNCGSKGGGENLA